MPRLLTGWLFAFLLLTIMFGSVNRVQAHANLERSEPAANATLTESPDEIRLWFTEPLETAFSRITLRDSSGVVVDIPPSQVDTTDRHQIFVPSAELPDGLYTVSWRVTSSADGHSTQGSFSFGINVTATSSTRETIIEPPIPVESVFVRVFNLLAASLVMGSVGFLRFVWSPTTAALPTGWQQRLIGFGWGCLGAALVLALALQTSLTADLPFFATFTSTTWRDVISLTTFGGLWLIRVLLWLLMGILLWRGRGQPNPLRLTLALGALFLLVQSGYSHASAVEDRAAAVAANWLHLLATTLWLGGLIGFLLTLLIHRRDARLSTTFVATLVVHFSNYARVTVAALVITGVYAAWLHVGSLPALLNTVYGQALLVKMLLFFPLLLIAGVNLIWTRLVLHLGQIIWIGRLRGLIGVEIALLTGILLAVGILTSGSPARPLQAAREARSAVPTVEPYFGMETAGDGQMIHLEVIPATVGQNDFIITPFDENGEVITDVSSIRMRFESLDQAVGTSELRPEAAEPGVYRVSGTNLSLPGRWRIRLTIQRPGMFDIVVPFMLELPAPQAASPMPVNPTMPLSERAAFTGVIGITLLAAGGFFLGQKSAARLTGSHMLSGAMILVGLIALLNAAGNVAGGGIILQNAWARPISSGMTTAIYLSIVNNTPFPQQLIDAHVSLDAAVELHQTQINDNIARMQTFVSVQIPPFSTFEIAPGGYHLMLTDLQQDLRPGQNFTLTLTFANGSSSTIPVMIQNQPLSR